MRRLASLLAGGALFLLLGAIPALADGGPHSLTGNSGTAGLTSDSCAGCHRTHTAPAPLLLVEEESAMCLTCHGDAGNGATTDVMNGIQYATGTTHSATPDNRVILGALRGGGFANARIDTGDATRLTYTRKSNGPPITYPTTQAQAVGVLAAGEPVTSRHLNPAASVASTSWGSGALGTNTTGASITMECTSCHNPHGNGQFRLLDPTPGDGDGAFVEASVNAPVTDVLDPIRLHNYTVIQKLSTTATFTNGTIAAGNEGAESGYLVYADQIDDEYGPTVGDYFHRNVPWYGRTDYTAEAAGTGGPVIGSRMNDAPNGKPLTFDAQINAWCSQCHTRYLDGSGTQNTPGSFDSPSGDTIFSYRHSNTSNKPCTTCHVAHGSNATMTGFAATALTPADLPSASSRLLKIDNRGTCQACHDPTETVPAGTFIGPVPNVP